MPEKKKPAKADYNPHFVRKPYLAAACSSIRDDYDWIWDESRRESVYVKVGETDFNGLISANFGHDVRSVIMSQPGRTPMEKFENAVAAGLTPAPEGNPFIATERDPLVSTDEYQLDVFDQQVAYRKGHKKVDELNELLGRSKNNSFTAEDFLAGKADAAIQEFIKSKLIQSASAEKGESE